MHSIYFTPWLNCCLLSFSTIIFLYAHRHLLTSEKLKNSTIHISVFSYFQKINKHISFSSFLFSSLFSKFKSLQSTESVSFLNMQWWWLDDDKTEGSISTTCTCNAGVLLLRSMTWRIKGFMSVHNNKNSSHNFVL